MDNGADLPSQFQKAKDAIGQVIVGQKDLIHHLQLALLTGGHVLVEGLPGLAKTLAVNTLAQVISADFKRIQFTPDLLPADLIGTSVYNPKLGSFSVNQGPIFTNILLADEINRAPPKVQSALLEVMQEKQVTISGTTFKAQDVYMVLATQNPIEQEGTYPLPEAQVDRFMMKVHIDYPTLEEEKEILEKMATLKNRTPLAPVLTTAHILQARELVDQIHVDPKVTQYILDIVFATRHPEKYGLDLKNFILYGASPRASIFLKLVAKASAFLARRNFVTPQDVKAIANSILCHRIKKSYEAEAEGVSSQDLVKQILDKIAVP